MAELSFYELYHLQLVIDMRRRFIFITWLPWLGLL